MRSLAKGLSLFAPIILVSACAEPYDPGHAWLDGNYDVDGDGWMAIEDCDDSDPAMSPSHEEICMDGIDNDCDGTDNGCGLDSLLDLSQADARLIGEAGGDHAGWSVASAGDVNGDGLDDIAIGAYEDDEGGEYAGAVYIFLGPVEGSLNLSRADAKLVGESAFDNAGWSVASAGDINRDGYDDIIVGAYGADTAGTSSGVAYIVHGPIVSGSLSEAAARLEGAGAYDYAGISVAGIGDTNGDGYPDVAVGAYGKDAPALEAGAVYVFNGPLLGVRSVSSANAMLLGNGADHWFGFSVAGAGDVDGDGRADLVVGAPGVERGADPDAGAAYLYLGPITGIRTGAGADAIFRGAAGNDRAGAAVDGGFDMNADGYADLVIGAWGSDVAAQDAGAAYIVHGPVVGTRELAAADGIITGTSAGDNLGISVAGIPDCNGDGRGDVLLGAVNDASGGPGAGAAWLVFGPVDVGELPSTAGGDVKLVGEVWNDHAGGAVASAGDINGDGFTDLLVGAHGNDSGGADSGATYLVRGAGW